MLSLGMWTARQKGRMADLVSPMLSMCWGSLGQQVCKGCSGHVAWRGLGLQIPAPYLMCIRFSSMLQGV